MYIPNVGDVSIKGPVNGLGEEVADGSYLLVTINPKHRPKFAFKLTELQAQDLAADLDRVTFKTKPE